MADTRFKKGHIPWNKNRKGIYSKKTKRKMQEGRERAWSNPNLRKRQSILTKIRMTNPKVRKKLSEAKKGKPSWNKGKKMLQISGEKHPMFGKTHSEEAKKKMRMVSKLRWANQEYRKRMSEVHKGKPSARKGKKVSEETKRKLRESHKGKPSARKGSKLTKEQKRRVSKATKKAMANPKIREKWLKANKERYLNPVSLEKIKEQSRRTILRLYESGSFPKQTNTKPERQIKTELIKRGYKEGIDFIHQYKFMNKFMCDFCFPEQKVIVEVHGDFWHANPTKYAGKKLHKHQIKGIGRDRSKKAYITKVDGGSWTYLVFWESDIKKDVSKCVDKIEEALRK